MGRILTVMLIFCLAVSHGRASAEAPHADGSYHHVIEHSAFGHVDADIATDDDDDSDAGTLGKAHKTVGHHAHSAADGMAAGSPALPAPLYQEVRERPADDPALRVRAVPPLAEPPSA